jgi:hypothetical protein
VLDAVWRLHESLRSVAPKIVNLGNGDGEMGLWVIFGHAAPVYHCHGGGAFVPYFEGKPSDCRWEFFRSFNKGDNGGFGDPDWVKICDGKARSFEHCSRELVDSAAIERCSRKSEERAAVVYAQADGH